MKCGGCGQDLNEDQLTLVARLDRNYCPACLSWVPLQRVMAVLLLLLLASSVIWMGNAIRHRAQAVNETAQAGQMEGDASGGEPSPDRTIWEKFYDEPILVYMVVGLFWLASLLAVLGAYQNLRLASSVWRSRKRGLPGKGPK